jgi:uncharacterized protein
MTKYCFLSIMFSWVVFHSSQAQHSTFDQALAKELTADDYGMKTYVMAILLAGDRVEEYTPEQRAEIQKGHMATINRLAEEGKLLLAGPFIDGKEKRGIFIFNVESKAAAEALTLTDPAIQAGVLKMELIEWYASAALQLIPEAHKKIQKTKF